MVVVVKYLDVCKQVELIVKTSNKTFDSTILIVVSRERRLSHWYDFEELVSFVLVATDMVIKFVAI